MMYLGIIFGAVFLSNILLNSLIGFPLYSKDTKLKDVVYIGLRIIIISLISALIVYPIHLYLLKPEEWTFLTPFISILIVFNIEMLINYMSKKLNISFLTNKESKPIVVVSSLVFIITLIMMTQANYLGAMAETLGLGLGYLLVTVLIFTIKPRLELPGVPKAFKGLPLMLITLGIIGMIFIGLAGIL